MAEGSEGGREQTGTRSSRRRFLAGLAGSLAGGMAGQVLSAGEPASAAGPSESATRTEGSASGASARGMAVTGSASVLPPVGTWWICRYDSEGHFLEAHWADAEEQARWSQRADEDEAAGGSPHPTA